ncbi:helix-turn-helix transcriptional regulator [Citrobacter amalonaticus]|uniref:helix-turn-helix domain-containing protein n=1 Tax=Citrobacter amalonaticus TaxID=35703 RepID=UPI001A2C35FF|nr:response regulator transcription factor [Citrobacter amalonaticus]HDQ2813310.1 response regulator transcription factor [Citrobacter amalonaticus]
MVRFYIDSNDIYFRYGFVQMLYQSKPSFNDFCFCDTLMDFIGPEKCNDLYIIVRDLHGKRRTTPDPRNFLLMRNVFEILYVHEEYEELAVRLCFNCEKKRLFVNIGTPLSVMYSLVLSYIVKVVSSVGGFDKKESSIMRCKCNDYKSIFTRREIDVIRLLKLGWSMAAIASYLNLNVKTVSHYKRSVMVKTGIRGNNILLCRYLSDLNIT